MSPFPARRCDKCVTGALITVTVMKWESPLVMPLHLREYLFKPPKINLVATTTEDVRLFRVLLSLSRLCKFDCHLGGAVTHVTSITELVKNNYLVLDKPMVVIVGYYL